MKPTVVIAGCGATGRALADRLVQRYSLVFIDVDAQALDELGEREDVRTVTGDATSTLVLRAANLEGAFHAIATTGNADVNLEFCRLALEMFGVKERLAVIPSFSMESRAPFEEIGVPVVSRAGSVASIIESQLDQGKRTTADVGLGIGEILEVTVQPHSPVIGKTLAALRPQSWILGAIYRKGQLVVPHGNTAIEKDDRCLLVGDPGILPAIAEYFQRGASEFPLQYGTNLCTVWEDSEEYLREAVDFVKSTAAVGLRLLVPPGVNPDPAVNFATECEVETEVVIMGEAWPFNYPQLQDDQDAACLMLPAPTIGLLERLGIGRGIHKELLNATPEPILIARGSQPYTNILVAVGPGPGSDRAVELAVDVTRKFRSRLTAIAVRPASFVSGEEYNTELEEALAKARNVATLYKIKLDTRLEDGNPVHRVLEAAKNYDLLVTAHRRWRRYTLTQPDVSQHLIVNAPCSVMVLPYGKDDIRGG